VGPQSRSLPIAEAEAERKPGYGLERALADSRLAHLWVKEKCRLGASIVAFSARSGLLTVY